MVLKRLFLLIFTCLSIALNAQTHLTGKVLDSRTKEPVIGENVIVKELQMGTITDEKGEFSITVPFGKYTVIFSSVNYETIEKEVNCDTEEVILNVSLTESVKHIDEVVVTTKTEALQKREKAMPIAVISIKDTLHNKDGGELGTSPNDLRLEKHNFVQKTNLNYLINQKNSINFNSVFTLVKGMPKDTLKDYNVGYKQTITAQ